MTSQDFTWEGSWVSPKKQNNDPQTASYDTKKQSAADQVNPIKILQPWSHTCIKTPRHCSMILNTGPKSKPGLVKCAMKESIIELSFILLLLMASPSK